MMETGSKYNAVWFTDITATSKKALATLNPTTTGVYMIYDY